MRSKVRKDISLSPDTASRLEEYAKQKGLSVSAVIEHWTWNVAKLKNDQIRGQISFETSSNAKIDKGEIGGMDHDVNTSGR